MQETKLEGHFEYRHHTDRAMLVARTDIVPKAQVWIPHSRVGDSSEIWVEDEVVYRNGNTVFVDCDFVRNMTWT